jgi:hypothetical protein
MMRQNGAKPYCRAAEGLSTRPDGGTKSGEITGHRDAATFERCRVLQRAAILEAGKGLESHQEAASRK